MIFLNNYHKLNTFNTSEHVVVTNSSAFRQSLAVEERYFPIPENFLVGAATAAYQVEGAWNVSDKSESVWDRWTHINDTYYGKGDNGDIAADSYHKYKEDVQLLKKIGVSIC